MNNIHFLYCFGRFVGAYTCIYFSFVSLKNRRQKRPDQEHEIKVKHRTQNTTMKKKMA